MSFVSSVASSSLFATTVATTTSTSLRPFANLNLSEDQRSQIRSIFQQAKSQGLSQTQVQQAINAVLTPDQQAQLQSDIQQFGQGASASTSATSSTQAPPHGTPPNPFTDPNGPFANLNLTSSQQSRIASILSSAKSQGLSFDQINAQISALLTPAQQTAFTGDLQNLPQPGAQNGQSGASTDLTANLDLTDTQKSQIDAILQQGQAGTLSQAQVLSAIQGVLTPAQQTALSHDVQTAQTQLSGHRHHGNGGASSSTSTSVATLPNGLTEADIQNQIAAATSVILNQLQNDVAGT
jgi:Spy/CpxP family protein refolding chaperone